jgi:SOS regulatory protein LexA
MLTEKQKKFFEKLKDKYGKEPLPSFESIAIEFGFRHKNSVWQYFNKFKEVDFIREINKKFFINPDMFGAVLFDSPVKAGFPSPAEEHIEKRVSLDSMFDIDAPSTFMFKVSGDSMIDLGIYEGDMVIVKKGSIASDGEVVLACVDGEYTLKTFRKKADKVFLEPANKKYPVIIPERELTIFGIVTGVVRQV